MIVAPLTWEEFLLGAEIGVRRRVNATRAGRRDYFNATEPWGREVRGALAELAFAKGANLYWPAATEPDRLTGDVAGFHVRSRLKDHGDLVIRDHDPDGGIFVLMTLLSERPAPGRPLCEILLRWRIAGWVRGDEGRRVGRRVEEDHPAFFVPQDRLHPWTDVSATGAPAELDLTVA